MDLIYVLGATITLTALALAGWGYLNARLDEAAARRRARRILANVSSNRTVIERNPRG